MTAASARDIERLFPGIEAHAIVEILDTNATLAELETASLLLADQDENLIDAKRSAARVLPGLLDILTRAGLAPIEDSDAS